MSGETDTLLSGDPVPFNIAPISSGSISYVPGSGEIIISEAGYYLVNWWVATDGAETSPTVTIDLELDGVLVSQASSPIVSGQVGGTAIVEVTTVPATLSLVNNMVETIFIPATLTQAGLTVTRISSL